MSIDKSEYVYRNLRNASYLVKVEHYNVVDGLLCDAIVHISGTRFIDDVRNQLHGYERITRESAIRIDRKEKLRRLEK